jgi:superfamily I DNA and/or RNA helicase
VVTQYNIQVKALRDALPPDARVGTIDKFQGQEAPVVVISTCATPEYACHGADDDDGDEELLEGVIDLRGARFAVRKNRLNVALSRAQCLAIVIGSEDAITKTVCQSLEDAAALSFYGQIIAEGKQGPKMPRDIPRVAAG